MKITVNGTPREVASDLTLSGLLTDLKLNPKTTLIELNGDVLERSNFEVTKLSDDDVVELVRFVGGG